MRVYIGPYKSWVGPYQIACFFFERLLGEDRAHKIGEWLADTWVGDACQWIDKKRKRNIKVKIHDYDIWGADHTLALIILPTLKLLNEHKHGAPLVDDEDVPEHLRSTSARPKGAEWDLDEFHFDRWDWVMNEMIFAFEHRLDESWQDAYRSGKIDHVMVPVDRDGNEVPKGEHKYYRMKDGPNHTYVCDYDGIRVVEERIQNGFRLFGKYYQALWD